jgi:hypothetical protein
MAFDSAGKGLAAQIFRPEPARLALLRSAWAVAVGPELARRTEVLAVEGRTLRVRVPDAGWRKVLHRMQGQIVYRLRAIAGELGPSRIGFSEGQVMPAAEPKAPAPPKDEGPVAMGAALAAAVDGIPDPELRAAFVAAAQRYLARVGPSRRTKETSDA